LETLKREKQDTYFNCFLIAVHQAFLKYHHITCMPLILKPDFLIIRIKKSNTKVKNTVTGEKKKMEKINLAGGDTFCSMKLGHP